MKKTNVLWLSRHEMTTEQLVSLANLWEAEVEELNIIHVNHTWQATEDAEDDIIQNVQSMNSLITEHNADAITGVLPPVALESLCFSRHVDVRIAALSPVSRQAPELRQGEGAIPFVHVRWARVV